MFTQLFCFIYLLVYLVKSLLSIPYITVLVYHILYALSPFNQLQDRESMVSLLVGAQYGVSQVINHKLSIMTTLTEFSCITRVELLPESDRVSLVKIYLQDIKVNNMHALVLIHLHMYTQYNPFFVLSALCTLCTLFHIVTLFLSSANNVADGVSGS